MYRCFLPAGAHFLIARWPWAARHRSSASSYDTISIVCQLIPSTQHTCCMACRRLSWQCSSGCGKASPNCGLLWQWGPPLGACRRRRRSMRARRARSGHCFHRQRSVGVHCLQFLQSVRMLLDIRVKVVLLVVHPSCSHYRPFLSATCSQGHVEYPLGAIQGSSSVQFS